MIRVHARSVAKARQHRDGVELCCPRHPSDEGQCRIIINALRREIDRLLRGIDRYALLHRPKFADTLATRPACETASDNGGSPGESANLASATATRKSYSVAALGPSLAPERLAALNDTTSSHLNTKALSSGERLVDLLA